MFIHKMKDSTFAMLGFLRARIYLFQKLSASAESKKSLFIFLPHSRNEGLNMHKCVSLLATLNANCIAEKWACIWQTSKYTWIQLDKWSESLKDRLARSVVRGPLEKEGV